FGLTYSYDTNTPAANGVHSLGFTNVHLSLTDFIVNTVRPLLDKVHTALQPFEKVAEALGKPLPVISNLVGHPYTLLDLAKDYGAISQSSYDFVQKVQQFLTFAGSIETLLSGVIAQSAGGTLQLGGFTLDPAAAADPTKLGKLAANPTGSSNVDQTKLQAV